MHQIGLGHPGTCRQYAFTERKYSQSENLILFTSRGLARRRRMAVGKQRDYYTFRGKDDQSPCGWSGEMCYPLLRKKDFPLMLFCEPQNRIWKRTLQLPTLTTTRFKSWKKPVMWLSRDLKKCIGPQNLGISHTTLCIRITKPMLCFGRHPVAISGGIGAMFHHMYSTCYQRTDPCCSSHGGMERQNWCVQVDNL